MTKFVNPYSFVPLVDSVDRGAPNGHSSGRSDHVELLSGKIDVSYKAMTPVSVQTATGKDDLPEVRFPGSALAGAVRSLHESMNGSCLRQIDAEFVPVYRDETWAANGRKLALVKAVSHNELGEVSEITICSGESIAVDVRVLQRSSDGPWDVRTGARFNLAKGTTVADGKVRNGSVEFCDDGRYVLLVSDTRARPKDDDEQNGRGSKPWYFHAFDRESAGESTKLQLPEEPTPSASTQEWDTWRKHLLCQFNQSLATVDDARPGTDLGATREDGKWTYAPVCRPPRVTAQDNHHVIGYRLVPLVSEEIPGSHSRKVLERIREGQPLWVSREGDEFRLSLSAIWRHVGGGSLRERLGDCTPCTDPQKLCASCQIFGAAEELPSTRVRQRRTAQQRSYRGHVMFSEVDVPAETAVELITLPRVDSPKPGAGQFYLEDTGVSGATALASLERGEKLLPPNDEDPAREWGSLRDEGRLRRIRGRKHYWTSTWQGPPNRPAQAEESNPETLRVVAIPAGETFEATVRFEGLTTTQLGGLVAALSPQLWAKSRGIPDSDKLRFRIGGGKNFGMGACVAEAISVEVVDASTRWLGQGARATREPQDLVKTWSGAINPPVRETWDALDHLLREGFVEAQPDGAGSGHDGIQYPPLDEAHPDGEFHFWQFSVGQAWTGTRKNQNGRRQHVHTARPLIVLPNASDGREEQILDSDDAKKFRLGKVIR